MATVFLSSLLNPMEPTPDSAPGSFLMGLARAANAPQGGTGFLDKLAVGSAGTGGLSPDASMTEIQEFARRKARKMFGPGQWPELKTLVGKESGWNPNAENPTSTASELFQFLDSTAANYGLKPTGNPVRKQVNAGLRYILDRYGDPEGALAFHLANGYY